MSLGRGQSQSHSWWQYWRRDVQPAPGRLNSSLRITLASIIVFIAMMVLRMPFLAYGLYVIFMVGRVNTAITLRTGIALLCSVACALSIALMIVILTDNNPMAQSTESGRNDFCSWHDHSGDEYTHCRVWVGPYLLRRHRFLGESRIS